MGRATIIGGGADGLYQVQLVKDAAGVSAQLARIQSRLAELSPAIDRAETDAERSRLRLESISLTKQAQAMAAAAAPDQRDAWCADLTEDLSGEVGTIEVNGDAVHVLVMPGGDTAAALGQIQHAVASTPAGVALNMALMPAWQRYRPTYRIGQVLDLDFDADTCEVGIEDQYSRYQGLPINQEGDDTWEATADVAVSGWLDFARRNPDFPLVTSAGGGRIQASQKLTEDLAAVNRYVNSAYRYTLDKQQYGRLEHWSLMAEGGSGDCEDFALTKARRLMDMGYPASAMHIEIGRTPAGEGHAWLIVRTSAGDIALDNLYAQPMRSWQLPYTDRQRQTGTDWAVTGVRLSGVPISYMDGANAAAFEVGDRVVVRFIDQDWARPEVIGFESHPRGPASIYALAGIDDTSRKIRAYGSPSSAPVSWLVGAQDSAGGYHYHLAQVCAGPGAGYLTVVRRKEPVGSHSWEDYGPRLDIRIYRATTGVLVSAIEVNLWEDPGIYEYFTAGLPATPIFTRIEHIGKISFSPTQRLLVPIVMRRSDMQRRYGAGWIELSGALVGRIMFFDYGITGIFGAAPPSGVRVLRPAGDLSYFLDGMPRGPGYPSIRVSRHQGVTPDGQAALAEFASDPGDGRMFDMAALGSSLYVFGLAAGNSAFRIASINAETLSPEKSVKVPIGSAMGGMSLFSVGGRLVATVSRNLPDGYRRLIYDATLNLLSDDAVPEVGQFKPSSCIA